MPRLFHGFSVPWLKNERATSSGRIDSESLGTSLHQLGSCLAETGR